ncbi:hypothetical protein AMATHDRAFT_46774 [Amanita thiersii Skay4041]|uniref:Uncharacterized protein n=1 Tax=Amanita thiersii Skay4041 TaxID=703135 RepID=A0A2A9NML6_9AGAR|nr:hypothetical protein AMATHDRAFT_46774 [Amanita thiersii Skay4041]
MFILAPFVLLAALRGVALAQQLTTMNLPGITQQPLTVDFIRVNAEGRTIWELDGNQLRHDATVTESPGYVSIHFEKDDNAVLTVDQECSLTSTTAFCSMRLNDGTEVNTTLSFQPVTVTVDDAPPATATGTPATASGTLTTASTASGTVQPGSTASTSKPTSSGSSTVTRTSTGATSTATNDATGNSAPGHITICLMTLIFMITVL